MEEKIKIGSRVLVLGKDLKGTVAFIGYTKFSAGKWFGVVLDEPKGKNNGCIDGIKYFCCPDQSGLFVRETQLQVIENKTVLPTVSGFLTPQTYRNVSFDEGSHLKRRMTFGSAIPKIKIQRIHQKSTPRARLLSSSSTRLNQSSFTDSPYHLLRVPSATPTNSSYDLRNLLRDKDQQIDELKREICCLNENLESLKKLQAKEQTKLNEAMKLKLEVDQLLEHKVKIMKVQADLQKELTEAKKEAKEAIKAKEKQAEEISDLFEATELAVLDKEMTEEKLEDIQSELEQTKEKYEKLFIKYEALKEEISKSEEMETPCQFKQLEQENEKLKEAVVQMRDLSTQDKQEKLKLMKEVDQLRDDIKCLREKSENLSQLSSDNEKKFIELQQQVDIFFGAENIIEQLTEKNLALEERIQKLQLSVDELEELKEVNELIEENSRELQYELQEELIVTRVKLQEKQKIIEELHDLIADDKLTINKFRDQIVQLQSKNAKLQNLLNERKEEFPISKLQENFKVKNIEHKYFVLSLELDLMRADLEIANKHINYLCAFMPQEFLSRGGDYDAILALLLIHRMVTKIEILTFKTQSKFPAPEAITKDDVLNSHVIDQYGFVCRLLYQLYFLLLLLNQYASILSNCDLDLFMKLRLFYNDMKVGEKSLDLYFDLLKKENLAENINLDPLIKARKYFQDIYNANLASEIVDCCMLMHDNVRLVIAACKSIYTDVSVITTFVDSSDADSWLSDIRLYANEICNFAKKIQRLIPKDGNTYNMVLPSEVQERLKVFRQDLEQTMDSIHVLRKLVLQEIDPSSHSRNMKTFSVDYIKEKCGEECTLGSMMKLMKSLAVYFKSLYFDILHGNYKIENSQPNNRKSPIDQRAQTVTKEARDLKALKFKLKDREDDIAQLQKSLLIKHEELNTMSLHKKMVERKLALAVKEKVERIDELQKQLESERMKLVEKENEFADVLNHLQTEIDSLETENDLLKDKLNSKIDLTSDTAFSKNPLQMSDNLESHDTLLSHQEQNLLSLVNNLKSENFRLQIALIRKQLDSLAPLIVPRKNVFRSSSETRKVMDCDCSSARNTAVITKKYKDLSQKVLGLCCPLVVDISHQKRNKGSTEYSPTNYLLKLAQQKEIIEKGIVELKSLINSTRKGKYETKTDFSMLPTLNLPLDYNAEKKLAAKIEIPQSSSKSANKVSLVLDQSKLRHLHSVML
ncbi:dynactin subunit 1-like [Stegodyphus dumicola]|uniref:dynactin subunit 1-like n=1 Tax=Stegodyphus dumicola TaxID=202533 RepID=UPI0015B25D95|nr:dynactin subunit 1-like [Stegodyphus dumicola]